MADPNPSRKTAPPTRPPKQRNTRLAWWIRQAGMSYQDVALALRQIATAEGRPGLARDRTRVAHWVSDSERPRPPVPEYLARILTHRCNLSVALTPSDLGMEPNSSPHHGLPGGNPSPATPDEEGDPTNRRTLLAALLPTQAGAGTVRSYTRHATATQIAPGDVEALELAVHHIGTHYTATPPVDLWPIVAAHRQHAFILLSHRHTLHEGRDLAHHAGMLSVILAWCAHDLGQRALLDALCDDGWEQGQQAGAPEVSAWAEDARATDAFYSGRPLDALTAATRGLAVAPRNGNAVIRLSSQLARAYARLGDTNAYTHAAANADRYRERLPLLATGLFAVDSIRITSYAASSLGWLGDHDKARTAATHAIEHYTSAPDHAPTRLAIARLDLARAHVELGEPEAAVETARQALAETPPVQSVHNRVDQLTRHLAARYPTLPLTSEFREHVHAR